MPPARAVLCRVTHQVQHKFACIQIFEFRRGLADADELERAERKDGERGGRFHVCQIISAFGARK